MFLLLLILDRATDLARGSARCLSNKPICLGL